MRLNAPVGPVSQVPVSATILWRCGGRQCGAGECAHEDDELHRHASEAGPAFAPPVVQQVLGTAGAPLPGGVRTEMESRLGHDFSKVRIHTDARAAASARAVQARAFTVGHQIVFGRGEFSPESPSGRHVLAHELVHTIQQQGRTPTAGSPGLRVSQPHDPAEIEAERIAGSASPVASHGRPAVRPATAPAAISRLPFGITLPGGARLLDASEITMATSVYGTSIDYSKVVITDATGGGSRPFTTVLPLGLIALNLGPSAYATPGSNRGLLIHELAHVWQSQHHPSAAAFMANSIASQAAAAAAGGSAYCYVPGKWFGLYAAEQAAEQAEDGVAAVISHMKGVTAGLPDPANIAGMAVPRFETRGAPGVRC